jgi:hypothetical protein
MACTRPVMRCPSCGQRGEGVGHRVRAIRSARTCASAPAPLGKDATGRAHGDATTIADAITPESVPGSR